MNYLNLFICTLELIPLLWNRFRTTFGDEKFYFEYNVLVETSQLGVFHLNPKRKQRLEFINKEYEPV